MAPKSTKSEFEAIRMNLQTSILDTTKLAAQIPAPADLRYQRTLSRPLGKKVDQASKRLLHITSRVLELAKQAEGNKDKGKKSVRNGHSSSDLQEEDVTDGYQNKIVKVTDYLLEQIDKNLDEAFQASKKGKQAQQSQNEEPIASTSRAIPSDSSASRNFRNAGDIRKPQLDFAEGEYTTSSSEIFKPLLPNKPHAIEPLDFTPVTYEDERTNGQATRIPNPYAKEIQAALQNPLPELENPYDYQTIERMTSQMDKKPYLFVDTPEKLAECLEVLKDAKVIAIDLEHHDFHTYRGITCLMQVSTITHDYIIDPLVPSVRSNLHTLNEAFANPNIVKVLHGADRDIIWLQRDFGVYIVNLFDTYHASRAINRLSGHSLASLLKEYTTFLPEKKYQLADWRIRPLTEELIQYARSDTHFLIYIFFAILNNPVMTPNILQDIRKRSAITASQVYEHAVYDLEEGYGSGGWRRLADKSGKLQIWGIEPIAPRAGTSSTTITTGAPEPWKWTDKQGRIKFEVFKRLHAWRDQTAREEDESTGFILSNKNLMAIAERIPEKMQDLVFSLGSDMKGELGKRSDAILEQVKLGKQAAEEILKQQAEKDATQRETVQPASSASLWSTETAPGTTGTSATTSAFATAFSVNPRASTSSSLFSSNKSTRASSKPASSGFANALNKVHRALLEQFQSPSSALLGQASTAVPATDEVMVKEEPEQSQQPVKQEVKQEDDGIVQINSRKKGKGKKRKTPDTESSSSTIAVDAAVPAKSSTSTQGKKPAYVKPFDYTGVKSVLDEPMEEQKPRKRPKKVKGGDQQGTMNDTTAEGPTFKRPPKSMNQPKTGNKSHTFV